MVKKELLVKYGSEEEIKKAIEKKIANGDFITVAEMVAVAKHLGYMDLFSKYECYIEPNTQYGVVPYDIYVDMINDIFDNENIILTRL